jgi:hypothetical protein
VIFNNFRHVFIRGLAYSLLIYIGVHGPIMLRCRQKYVKIVEAYVDLVLPLLNYKVTFLFIITTVDPN